MAVAAFSPTMALAVAYARATGMPYGIATEQRSRPIPESNRGLTGLCGK